MVSLTNTQANRSSRSLVTALTSSVAGVVVGAALAVGAGGTEFGGSADTPAAQSASTAQVTALASELEDLRAFNDLYRAAFSRLTADSTKSALPPAELDELYKTTFERRSGAQMSLEELNVMFDEAF